jgi:hypothetical protein
LPVPTSPAPIRAGCAGSLFGGAVSKDTVSRVWRKVKSDWDAWNARSLAKEPIVRLILDGTVVRVRVDGDRHVRFDDVGSDKMALNT